MDLYDNKMIELIRKALEQSLPNYEFLSIIPDETYNQKYLHIIIKMRGKKSPTSLDIFDHFMLNDEKLTHICCSDEWMEGVNLVNVPIVISTYEKFAKLCYINRILDTVVRTYKINK